MINLERPQNVYPTDLRTFLNDEEWSKWAAAVTAACERADSYARSSPLLTPRVSGLQKEEQQFFLGLYESRRKSILAWRTKLLQCRLTSPDASCQYCGIDQAETLDHYIEKGKEPELSVYARNLIPSCWSCNHGRGGTFTQDGARRIVHLYDDDLRTLPWVLRCDLQITSSNELPVLTYDVQPNAHDLSDVYVRHFGALKLAERYAVKGKGVLLEWRSRMRRAALTDSAIQKAFDEAAVDREAVWGRNDYKAALYHAIASSQAARSWFAAPPSTSTGGTSQ